MHSSTQFIFLAYVTRPEDARHVVQLRASMDHRVSWGTCDKTTSYSYFVALPQRTGVGHHFSRLLHNSAQDAWAAVASTPHGLVVLCSLPTEAPVVHHCCDCLRSTYIYDSQPGNFWSEREPRAVQYFGRGVVCAYLESRITITVYSERARFPRQQRGVRIF